MALEKVIYSSCGVAAILLGFESLDDDSIFSSGLGVLLIVAGFVSIIGPWLPKK